MILPEKEEALQGYWRRPAGEGRILIPQNWPDDHAAALRHRGVDADSWKSSEAERKVSGTRMGAGASATWTFR